MINITQLEIDCIITALKKELEGYLPFSDSDEADYILYKCVKHPKLISTWFETWAEDSNSIYIKYNCGASKIVFYSSNSNYVIKIPFMENKSSIDYCALEVNNYKEAKIYNVEEFFLETKKIGYINDCPIYVQEQATDIYPHNNLQSACDVWIHNQTTATYHPTAKDFKRLLEMGDLDFNEIIAESCGDWDWGELNSGFILEIINKYGAQTLINLKTFIDDCEINDLHKGNVGYLNNHPIFFDYSGYHG